MQKSGTSGLLLLPVVLLQLLLVWAVGGEVPRHVAGKAIAVAFRNLEVDAVHVISEVACHGLTRNSEIARGLNTSLA